MRVYKTISSAALAVSLFVSISCAVQGQAAPAPAQDVPVHLTAKQAASFPEALKSLATQGHVAFVAEGSPLHPKITEANAPNLQHDVALSTAVDKIAAAFDYTASRQGNVFVLEKNYTDPDDLPGVTPAECALALKDFSLVVAVFDPHLPRHLSGQDDPLIADLIHSLTPMQTQAMQNSFLSVAALTPDQKSYVYRMGLSLYLRNTPQALTGLATSILTKMPAYSVGVADWHFPGGPTFPHLFGYRVSDTTDKDMFRPFEGVRFQNGAVVGQTVDATAPLPAAPVVLPVDDGQTTLREAVAGLAADGKKPVTVDAALREKPLTVAGAENAPPSEVLAALTSVYGLRVRTDSDGTRVLTRVAFRIPLEVTGVPTEVRRVLPLPLLHLIHDSAVQEGRPSWDQRVATGGNLAAYGQKGLNQRVKQQREALNIPEAIQKAAIKRIYAAVASQLKATPAKFIPYSKLPEPAREAFAVYQMADTLGWVLNELTPELPVNLTRPESIVLTGGPYTDPQGKAKFTLTVKYVSPDGQVLPLYGLGNMEASIGGGG